MASHITRDGKWILWHRTTGQALLAWPVDAREMLAYGDECEYTLDQPAEAADLVEPEPEKPQAPPSVHPLGIMIDMGGGTNLNAPTGPVLLPVEGARTVGDPRELK